MQYGKHVKSKFNGYVLKIFSSPLTFALLFILIIKPYCIVTLCPILSEIDSFGVLFFLCLISFICLRFRQFSRISIAVCAFQAYFLLMTCINGGNVSSAFLAFCRVVGLCLLIEFGLEKSPEQLLKGALITFFIYLFVNLGTIVCFPQGLYLSEESKNPCFFLGHRNSLFRVLLPGLLFSYLYDVRHTGKIGANTIAFYVFLVISVLFVKSANAIVTIAMIPIIYFICKKNMRILRHGAIGSFLLAVAGTLFFVVLKLQNVLSVLIVDVLGKDLTLTGRASIWESALRTISERPIFGYGVENSDVITARFWGVTSTHNYLLDVLYQGGLIALILLVMVLIVADSGMRGAKNNLAVVGVVVCIATFFINGVVEPIGVGLDNNVVIPLVLGFHANKLGSASLCLLGDEVERT